MRVTGPDDRVVEAELRAGLEIIRVMSEAIGPRPPCSEAEAEAADLVAGELRGLGIEPTIEEFPSAKSFGAAYLAVFVSSLAGATLQRVRSFRKVGFALAFAAAVAALSESRFPRRGLLSPLRRKASRNLHATIEPEGPADRTVCLMCHLDSSRSGLMFHPRVTPALGKLVAGTGVATLLLTVSAPLANRAGLRWIDRASRGLVTLAVLLVVERELFGQDVPGANDNASGVGACVALGRALVRDRTRRTRIVLLFTGSEESGPLGIRDFLERHETEDWRFINFDGVGANAPLRVLSREGGPLSPVKADPELLEMAADIGREDQGLEATPLDFGSGLPYDATPVLARGGKAITVANQDGAIPDYHWPTDRFDRISPAAFERAVRFGRRLVDRIDQDGP